MKTKIHNILLGGLITLSLASCNDDRLFEGDNNMDPILPTVEANLTITSEVADDAKNNPSTRVEFDTPLSARLCWTSDDELGVFAVRKAEETAIFKGAASASVSKFEASLTSGADQYFATFTPTSNPVTVGAINDFCIFYPSSSTTGWDSATKSKHTSQREREQIGFSNSSHIGKYGFATAIKLNQTVTSGANVNLNSGKLIPQVAYYAIALDKLIKEGESKNDYGGNTVDSLVFTVIKKDISVVQPKLWGECYIDWSKINSKVGVEPTGEHKKSRESIVVKCKSMVLPTSRPLGIGTLNVYFTSLPVIDVDQYQVKIYMRKTDGIPQIYQFTKEVGPYSFRAGSRYSMQLGECSDEEVVDFMGNYGAYAYIYYGDADRHNNYQGNGWVDSYNGSVATPQDLELTCFKFRTNTEIKITAPKTVNDIMYGENTTIDAWKGKTYGEIAAADRTITILEGVDVTLSFKLAKGTFKYEWDVILSQTKQVLTLTLDRRAPVSYVGQRDFIKYNKIKSYSLLAGEDNCIENNSATKTLHVNENPTVVVDATLETTDRQMGFRAVEYSLTDKENVKSYYYISQVGLGFSARAIRMAKIKTTDAWTYYIPSSSTANSDYFANVINNESDVVFMIGKTEGLEIPNSIPNGTKWDDFTTLGKSRKSWTPHHLSGYPNVPNAEGMYSLEDKQYVDFEFNGTDSPCDFVYPRGTWRAPTNEEVNNWKVSGSGYDFPHLQNHGQLQVHIERYV